MLRRLLGTMDKIVMHVAGDVSFLDVMGVMLVVPLVELGPFAKFSGVRCMQENPS